MLILGGGHGRRRASRRARRRARLVRALLPAARHGRLGGARARRRARDRQDPPARRARRTRADARGQLVLSGSASELERDLPFWVFVDALDEYVQGLDPRRLDALDDDVRDRARDGPPVAVGARTGTATAALQHERYRSHRAVRELLELLASTQPLVLVLDDLHWADPASVELLGALLHRPPAARRAARAGRASPPGAGAALASRSSGRTAPAPSTRFELGALTRSEAGELLGDTVGDGADGDRALRGERRQPLLPRAARPDARSSRTRRDLAAPEILLARRATSRQRRRGARGGARPALRRALAACSRARRWPAIPFEPELAAAAAGDDRGRGDRRARRAAAARPRPPRPTCPGAFASGIRSSAGRSTSRRPAAGGSARTSAAPRRSRRAARPPRRAPTTSSSRHARATRPRSRPCARPARRPRSARRRAPRAGSAPRCACSPRTRRREERVELLLARSERAGRRRPVRRQPRDAAREHQASCPHGRGRATRAAHRRCAGVEHLLGRHTEAHARLEAGLAELEDPDSPEAVALMIELAADGLYRADYDGDEPMGGPRRSTAAAPLGDRALTAAALAVRATAAALAGDGRATAQAYRRGGGEADRRAVRRGARPPPRRARAPGDRGDVPRPLRRGRPPRRSARSRSAARPGQGDLFPLIFPMLGTALWVQGRVAESAEVLDGAVEGARLLEQRPGARLEPLQPLLRGARGRRHRDWRSPPPRRASSSRKSLDESLVSAWAAVALAAALLESGDAAARGRSARRAPPEARSCG